MAMKVAPTPVSTLDTEICPIPWALMSDRDKREVGRLRSLISDIRPRQKIVTSESKYKPTSQTKLKPKPKSVKQVKSTPVRTVDTSSNTKPTKPVLHAAVAEDESDKLAAWFMWKDPSPPPFFKYPFTQEEKNQHIWNSWKSEASRYKRLQLQAEGITPGSGHKSRQKAKRVANTMADYSDYQYIRNHPYTKDLAAYDVEKILMDKAIQTCMVHGARREISLNATYATPRVDSLLVDRQLINVLEEQLSASNDPIWDSMTGLPYDVDDSYQRQINKEVAFYESIEASPSVDNSMSEFVGPIKLEVESPPWDESELLYEVDQRDAPVDYLNDCEAGSDLAKYVAWHRFHDENPNYRLDFIDIYTVGDGSHDGTGYIETLRSYEPFNYLRESIENRRGKVVSGYHKQMGTWVHPLYQSDPKAYAQMIEHYSQRRPALCDYGLLNVDETLESFNRRVAVTYPTASTPVLTAIWDVEYLTKQKHSAELAEKVITKAQRVQGSLGFAKWNRDIASEYTPDKCAARRMSNLKDYLNNLFVLRDLRKFAGTDDNFSAWVATKEKPILNRIENTEFFLQQEEFPSNSNVVNLHKHAFDAKLSLALTGIRNSIMGLDDRVEQERCLQLIEDVVNRREG